MNLRKNLPGSHRKRGREIWPRKKKKTTTVMWGSGGVKHNQRSMVGEGVCGGGKKAQSKIPKEKKGNSATVDDSERNT